MEAPGAVGAGFDFPVFIRNHIQFTHGIRRFTTVDCPLPEKTTPAVVIAIERSKSINPRR
jgi:hypothetical protein